MRKTFLCLPVLLLGSSIALAATEGAGVLKIGTVDMQRAIQSVEAGKAAKATLEKDVRAKKASLSEQETSLKKADEEFKKQSLVMNDEARAKKQGELQEKLMKLQQQAMRSQQELQAREAELTQPIVKKLREVIAEMAKTKGYTVVLEKNENTVLYSMEKDDLTTDVITAFNKAK